MTRTPPRPWASDLKLVHPVANDSEAGRAPGRAAAGTSGHAQQHARPAAAMPHACWRPEPGRTVAASKLTCRVTGPRTTGTRKDGSASGSRDRIRTFIKEAYCPTIGAAVHSQPRAGLQPGRPYFGFPRGVGGPGRRHENYGFSENKSSVWLGSTVFFRIPEANEQLYGPIDMTKREQIVYFQLRMNLFFFIRSMYVPCALRID